MSEDTQQPIYSFWDGSPGIVKEGPTPKIYFSHDIATGITTFPDEATRLRHEVIRRHMDAAMKAAWAEIAEAEGS